MSGLVVALVLPFMFVLAELYGKYCQWVWDRLGGL